MTKGKEITFDKFIRILFGVFLAVIAYLLLRKLSGVLMPFVVAWLVAYMLNPFVNFIQKKCHIKLRWVAILITFILFVVVVGGICWLIIPAAINEILTLKDIIVKYVNDNNLPGLFTEYVMPYIRSTEDVKEYFSVADLTTFLETMLPKIFSLISSSISAVFGVVMFLISFIYLFYILMDYEKMTKGYIKYVPQKHRAFVQGLVADVEEGMNSYFRGQSLVALCVGILFSIGFVIIGFPMAIPLGLFIGFLNLVPYLQVLGFVPTVILSLLKSYETGQNFWGILLAALLVFAVVQIIQDGFLVPKIMGNVTGLNGAVILLSLSVWGVLLGFVGLIIALPLTTLLISYYKRYVIGNDADNDKSIPVKEEINSTEQK
ncbi:MAG: AI-2E family transporter [Bacteroidaceae bacterium]